MTTYRFTEPCTPAVVVHQDGTFEFPGEMTMDERAREFLAAVGRLVPVRAAAPASPPSDEGTFRQLVEDMVSLESMLVAADDYTLAILNAWMDDARAAISAMPADDAVERVARAMKDYVRSRGDCDNVSVANMARAAISAMPTTADVGIDYGFLTEQSKPPNVSLAPADETLREALRPFADYGDWIDSGETEGWDDGDVLTVSSGTVTCGEFNVGDFRRARKALGEQT